MTIKVGIAGLGAIGGAVAKALQGGIMGYTLHMASENAQADEYDIPLTDFAGLAEHCDLVIECLPPAAVPSLAREVFLRQKDMVVISSCALLMYPEILEHHQSTDSRILVPSGALAGIDGVRALAQLGITSARIASTKKPQGFAGAPYVLENNIDLDSITEKQKLFSGDVLTASKGFPANVNVAATLSLAGPGPDKTQVEIWADPAAPGNTHEIEVASAYSTITARIENKPDPKNPKSSMLAAQSIVSLLKGLTEPVAVF